MLARRPPLPATLRSAPRAARRPTPPTSTRVGTISRLRARLALLFTDSYNLVLKQVHPDTGISQRAMSILNSFVNGMFMLGCNCSRNTQCSHIYQISSSVSPLRPPSLLPTTRSLPSPLGKSRPLSALSSPVSLPSTPSLRVPRPLPSTPLPRNKRWKSG